jgi:hypothetical protein
MGSNTYNAPPPISPAFLTSQPTNLSSISPQAIIGSAAPASGALSTITGIEIPTKALSILHQQPSFSARDIETSQSFSPSSAGVNTPGNGRGI